MRYGWVLVLAMGCSGNAYSTANDPYMGQGYEESDPYEDEVGADEEGTDDTVQQGWPYEGTTAGDDSRAQPFHGTQVTQEANKVTPSGQPECAPVLQQVVGSGGCQITLVGPDNCAKLDFSAGTVEFAWSTNGTFCEGPHRFFLGGHPSSTWQQDNGFVVDIGSTGGDLKAIGSNGSSYAMTRNIGGLVRLSKADLAGITTTTGQYHWGVTGFYDVNNGGSSSGTRTFLVR